MANRLIGSRTETESQTIADIGHMTHGIRDNALDLADIWLNQHDRRIEFGQREIEDLREAAIVINQLVGAIMKRRAA